MKRLLAAFALLALATACHDPALASSEGAQPRIALCAAAHSIPSVLLALHRQKIGDDVAVARLAHVRHMIDANASGRYARHLKDVAAAVRVFEIVTKNRGDTSDAYRDLRTLRESLPPCPGPVNVVRHTPGPAVTND